MCGWGVESENRKKKFFPMIFGTKHKSVPRKTAVTSIFT